MVRFGSILLTMHRSVPSRFLLHPSHPRPDPSPAEKTFSHPLRICFLFPSWSLATCCFALGLSFHAWSGLLSLRLQCLTLLLFTLLLLTLFREKATPSPPLSQPARAVLNPLRQAFLRHNLSMPGDSPPYSKRSTFPC